MWKNKIFLAHMSMIITTMIYALNYTIAKTIMPDPFDSSTLVFIRLLVATLLFFFIFKFFVNQKIKWRQHGIAFILASITGVVINTLLFFKGLSLSKPIDASIIMSLTPIITFIFAVIIGTEKPSIFAILGALIAFTGLYTLITGFSFHLPNISFGNILLFINMTAYAAYLIYIKKLTGEYNAITITFYTFLFALPVVAMVGFDGLNNFSWHALNTDNWLALGFVVIFVTVFTYLLIVFSAKHLKASVLGFYTYLQPVFTIGFALAIGSDTLSPLDGLSAVLVMVGLILINRTRTMPRKVYTSAEKITPR